MITWYGQITNDTDTNIKICASEFETWKKESMVDLLKGMRYGQSFCNKFDITDNLLYYCLRDEHQIHSYIEKNYLQ